LGKGRIEGVLDLPQNLGLADNKGVEARGDPENVLDGIGGRVAVQVRQQLAPVDAEFPDKKTDDFFKALFGVFYGSGNFYAVAGRKDKGLINRGQVQKAAEGLGQLFGFERQLFAERNIGGIMIEAYQNYVHTGSFMP
jgi:hypothetical protein